MTTVELRTSIVAELDQMSVEMLESVSHYVRRLRRPARRDTRAAAKDTETAGSHKPIEITPGVARLRNVKRWHIADEERDRQRYEYLTEKFK